jgi:hypothetical protein
VEESVQLRLAFRGKVLVYEGTPPCKPMGEESTNQIQGCKVTHYPTVNIALVARAKTHVKYAVKIIITTVAE